MVPDTSPGGPPAMRTSLDADGLGCRPNLNGPKPHFPRAANRHRGAKKRPSPRQLSRAADECYL